MKANATRTRRERIRYIEINDRHDLYATTRDLVQ